MQIAAINVQCSKAPKSKPISKKKQLFFDSKAVRQKNPQNIKTDVTNTHTESSYKGIFGTF